MTFGCRNRAIHIDQKTLLPVTGGRVFVSCRRDAVAVHPYRPDYEPHIQTVARSGTRELCHLLFQGIPISEFAGVLQILVEMSGQIAFQQG